MIYIYISLIHGLCAYVGETLKPRNVGRRRRKAVEVTFFILTVQ